MRRERPCFESVLPALQKQVSDDFKAYWELDCTLTFLNNGQPLTRGWWQVVITDNPDQAGALGYHEMTTIGTPLGKVFAKLDMENGSSWTATLSHELLEMLADPWINWCHGQRQPDLRARSLRCSGGRPPRLQNRRRARLRFHYSSMVRAHRG